MSWWYRATAEQKLAQIDAAIELGMTAGQIAMNCGTIRTTVFAFANYHGRYIAGGRTTATPGQRRASNVRAFRNAYFKGEPVDAWSVE